MVLGLLMIAAQLAYRGWALAGSWFYFDDLAFMSRALNQPYDLAYLTESYGGHLMPAGFAVTWLLTKWAVFDWTPWAALLLAMQAVAGVGMLRLLLSLFGRRRLVLTTVALWLAHVYAHTIGQSVSHERRVTLAELEHIARREGAIVEATLSSDGELPARRCTAS